MTRFQEGMHYVGRFVSNYDMIFPVVITEENLENCRLQEHSNR